MARLDGALAAGDRDSEVTIAWQCYQQLRSIYHAGSRVTGAEIAAKLVASLPSCPIPEVARLGRTLRAWRTQLMAYFVTDRISNGGTEAINLDHRQDPAAGQGRTENAALPAAARRGPARAWWPTPPSQDRPQLAPGVGLRAETVGYHPEPYTMRTSFRAVSDVDLATALRRSLPAALRWLSTEEPATSRTLAGATACQHLADLIRAGLEPWQRDHLGYFAIRVGARRLADAATWLTRISATTAAEIADHQAQLVGALQHPLVTDDRVAMTEILRRLAPTYEQLRASLADLISQQTLQPAPCTHLKCPRD